MAVCKHKKQAVFSITNLDNGSHNTIIKAEKRKVDAENCQFNSDWTEKHVHIETASQLVCNECSSVAKERNLFAAYPLICDAHEQKIQPENYKRGRVVIM